MHITNYCTSNYWSFQRSPAVLFSWRNTSHTFDLNHLVGDLYNPLASHCAYLMRKLRDDWSHSIASVGCTRQSLCGWTIKQTSLPTSSLGVSLVFKMEQVQELRFCALRDKPEWWHTPHTRTCVEFHSSGQKTYVWHVSCVLCVLCYCYIDIITQYINIICCHCIYLYNMHTGLYRITHVISCRASIFQVHFGVEFQIH